MAEGTHGDGHEGHDHKGNCDDALHELYTFLDGELTESKRVEIKSHLDDCSPCLEVYDFEAELRLVIKHRCQDQVPEALREKVARKLAAIDAESTGADAAG
jgi:anti-sigma factor (TIGR02949 family)